MSLIKIDQVFALMPLSFSDLTSKHPPSHHFIGDPICRAGVIRFAQTVQPDRRKDYRRSCNFERIDTMVGEQREAQILIGLGSQGTAALGIMTNLLLALVSKGALRDIEVVAILDSAAETAEKSTDESDGKKYAKSVAAHIRQMIDPFAKPVTLERMQ